MTCMSLYFFSLSCRKCEFLLEIKKYLAIYSSIHPSVHQDPFLWFYFVLKSVLFILSHKGAVLLCKKAAFECALCVCVFQKSMAEGEEAMGQEDWKDKCMVLEALLMKFRMQIIKIRDLTADKVSWSEQNSATFVNFWHMVRQNISIIHNQFHTMIKRDPSLFEWFSLQLTTDETHFAH